MQSLWIKLRAAPLKANTSAAFPICSETGRLGLLQSAATPQGLTGTAERFYDILSQSDKFPPDLAIETRAMDSIFKNKGAQDRLLFLGCFLAHLRSWQAKLMMEQNRFPFMFEWQGRLKVIVDMCKEAKAAEHATR